MSHTLLHIYGPFAIEWYGLMIFVAIMIFVANAYFDERRKNIITINQLFDCVTLAIIVGIACGRLLFVATNWDSFGSGLDMLCIWDGGFSLLGSIIGIASFLPLYAWVHAIAMLRLCDFFAVYAPLVISISRLGCFMAGCCYGISCNSWMGVTYKHHNGYAPVGVPLHPTQLYSASILFFVFLFLRFCICPVRLVPGQLMMIFLFFVGLERFCVDFWRADRELLEGHMLSIHQYIALGLMILGLILFILLSFKGTKTDESL